MTVAPDLGLRIHVHVGEGDCALPLTDTTMRTEPDSWRSDDANGCRGRGGWEGPGRRDRRSILARIERGAAVGPWFEWATVDPGAIGVIANRAGLTVTTSWSGGGRRFAHLELCARARR